MMEVLSKTIITLNINGEYKEVVAKPSDILLHTLRNELGLTGLSHLVKMEIVVHVLFL